MESRVDEEKWILHYSSRHQILVVCEGDFSFAACLSKALGNASNIIASSLDSPEILEEKHPTAAENMAFLKNKGCTVLHEIDACSMSRHPNLEHKRFDRIVFNLPHFCFYHPEPSAIQISLLKDVLRGFLRNSYEMMTEKGEVHITQRVSYHYIDLKIQQLGQEVGLQMTRREIFYIDEYPLSAGDEVDFPFHVGVFCTYKFAK